MRKLTIILSLCVVLGTLAYYSWIKKDSTLGVDRVQFMLAKPWDVTRIQLSSKEYEAILIKSDNDFTIEGKEADIKRIQFLILLSSGIEITAPAPLSMQNTLSEAMENGISVQFFKRRKSLLSFRLCRYENQMYARLDGSEEIYKISIKGYPNVDYVRICDPYPDHWKSHTLFNLSPENIDLVRIEYPETPSEGFLIIRSKDKSLLLLDDTGKDTLSNIDMNALHDYLYFFDGIKYTPEPKEKDFENSSISSDNLFFSMRITTSTKDTISLKGYRKPSDQSGKIDRYLFYGVTPENEYLILNYTDFDPILVPREYFRKK